MIVVASDTHHDDDNIFIHVYTIFVFKYYLWYTVDSKQASSIQIISISLQKTVDIDICSFVMKMPTYYEWIKKIGSRNKMCQLKMVQWELS